jgi:hypothetical protein
MSDEIITYVAKFTGDISELERSIETVTARAGSLTNSLTGVTASTTALSTGAARTNETISRFSAGLAEANSGAARVSAALQATTDGVGRLDGAASGVSGVVATTTTKLAALNAGLQQTATSAELATTAVTGMAAGTAAGSSAIDKISAAISASLDKLKPMFSALWTAGTAAMGALATGVGGAMEQIGLSVGAAGVAVKSFLAVFAMTPLGMLTTAIAGITTACGAMTHRFLGATTEVTDLADALDIGTGAAQRLMAAASATGTPLDDLTMATKNLSATLADTEDNGQLSRDVLDRLGVSLTDTEGRARGMDAVLLDTVSALSQIPNEAERCAIAGQLFGDRWESIAPLIDNATVAEQAYIAATPFTDKEIGQATKLNHQVAELGNRFSGAADKIVTTVGSALVPAFLKLTDILGSLFDRIQAGWEAIEPFVATITAACEKVIAVRTALFNMEVAATKAILGIPTAPQSQPPLNPVVSPVQHGAVTGGVYADVAVNRIRGFSAATTMNGMPPGGGGGTEISLSLAADWRKLLDDIGKEEQDLLEAQKAIQKDDERIQDQKKRGVKLSDQSEARYRQMRALHEKTIFDADSRRLELAKRRDALLAKGSSSAGGGGSTTVGAVSPSSTTTSSKPPEPATAATPGSLQLAAASAHREATPVVTIQPTNIPAHYNPDLLKHATAANTAMGEVPKQIDITIGSHKTALATAYQKIKAAHGGVSDVFSALEGTATTEEGRWALKVGRLSQLAQYDAQIAQVQEPVRRELQAAAVRGDTTLLESEDFKKLCTDVGISAKELGDANVLAKDHAEKLKPRLIDSIPGLLQGVPVALATVATTSIAMADVARAWRGYRRGDKLDTALDRLVAPSSPLTTAIAGIESSVSSGIRSGFREVNAKQPWNAYAHGGQMAGDVHVTVNAPPGDGAYNSYKLAGIISSSVVSAVALGAAGFAVAGPVGAAIGGLYGGSALAKWTG